MEDVGGLGHLDHEGRLAAGEIVAGADAAEDFVDDADVRSFGGHIGAHLRQDGDERDLADEGRFAGHIRPGDEIEALIVPFKKTSLGMNVSPADRRFDDGMASLLDVEDVALIDERAHVSRTSLRVIGKGEEAVDLRRSAWAILRTMPAYAAASLRERMEQFVFQRADLFFGMEHFVFELFELGRDEPLGIDEGLPSLKMSGILSACPRLTSM